MTRGYDDDDGNDDDDEGRSRRNSSGRRVVVRARHRLPFGGSRGGSESEAAQQQLPDNHNNRPNLFSQSRPSTTTTTTTTIAVTTTAKSTTATTTPPSSSSSWPSLDPLVFSMSAEINWSDVAVQYGGPTSSGSSDHQPSRSTHLGVRTLPRTSSLQSSPSTATSNKHLLPTVLRTLLADSGSVEPPSDVRVEATSNSSVVVQWDYLVDSVDGFVVKYVHDESDRTNHDKWQSSSVMSTTARHVEIRPLQGDAPYAFCVLAVRHNRQSACSDPPVVMQKLTPTYVVSNLQVEWRTSSSVSLRWAYDGPQPVGFYLNHTGRKEYYDQHLNLKSMSTPGFRQELDGQARSFLWTNLRPAMRYTLHVGVRTLPPNARNYWPKEVVVMTESTGPPFVDAPVVERAVVSSSAGGTNRLAVRLRPASEEYGPISHYWLIVVPANYTQEDVLNMESSALERQTRERARALAARHLTVSPTKRRLRRSRTATQPAHHRRRMRRRVENGGVPNGVYVTAGIRVDDMRDLFRTDRLFLLGDQKTYDGFANLPLDANQRYYLMMRAFARSQRAEQGRRASAAAPMGERLARLYTDSALSEPFSTNNLGGGVLSARGSGSALLWMVGPAVAIVFALLLIGMLVCWWLRCARRGNGTGAAGNARGSLVHKAQLGAVTSNGSHTLVDHGPPSETSKLLAEPSLHHPLVPIMNPYAAANGGGGDGDNNGHVAPSLSAAAAGAVYPSQSSTATLGRTPRFAPFPDTVALTDSTIGGAPSSIPITQLFNHIQRLRADNNLGFLKEFESIETDSAQLSWDASSAEWNKHKNRYANVVAYEHTRVVLPETDDGGAGSDYINANYIDGHDRSRAYIATQGPLADTTADFWRMVWLERCGVIVMLTNLEERSRNKCDQYWPSRGSVMYGHIQVSLTNTCELAHYTMRTLVVQMVGETAREVRHLQFTAWPDHGVPQHPTPFIVFLRRAKSLLSSPLHSAGPMIVHCSAGVGRTGAFLAIDLQLERLRLESSVDIYGCVATLRSQRSYMVQTEDQYEFIYDAVLDAVNSGCTDVPLSKLERHAIATPNSPVDVEFRQLVSLRVDGLSTAASLPVNRAKNRSPAALPLDLHRVRLLAETGGHDGSDYINASWIDGYTRRSAYIAAQTPLPHTLADFWRMVWETNTSILVHLDSDYQTYWPTDRQPLEVGQFVVDLQTEFHVDHYELREMRLIHMPTGGERVLRQFHFVDWPTGSQTPLAADRFVEFVDQVLRARTQFGVEETPLVVACETAGGRTGAWLAVAVCLERLRLEQLVDLFTTLKLLRIQRPALLDAHRPALYSFLYSALLHYTRMLLDPLV